MKYLKRFLDGQGGYQIELDYEDGRAAQPVSEQQDLYLAWLAAGGTPQEVAYAPPPVVEPTWPLVAAAIMRLREQWMARVIAARECGDISSAQWTAVKTQYTALKTAQADGKTPAQALDMVAAAHVAVANLLA